MRNYGNGVENRCGGGSRKAFGGDFTGLILIIGMEMGAEERERTARNLRNTAAEIGLPLEGMEKGLYLPAEMLEDAGFSHVTRLDDLACTIEKGRILIEAPDEEDDAEVWDALREELPEGVCALLEDLVADPTAVWDILEKEGWSEC